MTRDLMTESLGKLNYFGKEAPCVVESSSPLKDDLFALEYMLEPPIRCLSLDRLAMVLEMLLVMTMVL